MAERPGGESQSSDLDNVFIRLPTNFAARKANVQLRNLDNKITKVIDHLSSQPSLDSNQRGGLRGKVRNMLDRFIPRRKQ